MSNTHPNSIFRWEDAASLEHACWQCPTKANSPRALQTCYGIHSMPCPSYHPTMHAVGAAHRCSGCVTTREMHEARHREIAELVAEYKALESPIPETPTGRAPLSERDVNAGPSLNPRQNRPGSAPVQVVQYNRTTLDDLDEEDFNYENNDPDPDPEPSTDFDAMSICSSSAPSTAATTTIDPSTSTTTLPRKLTKSELRSLKKAKKSAKSQHKALKNQTRHLATVTTTDISRVAQILHGDDQDTASLDGSAHPLATDKTIEDVIARNLGFVKNIQAHKQDLFRSVAEGRRERKERTRVRKRAERGEAGEVVIEMGEVVSAIMLKLGIAGAVVSTSASVSSHSSSSSPFPTATKPSFNTPAAPPSQNSRRAQTLHLLNPPSPSTSTTNIKDLLTTVTKLRAAIKNDLEKHENEVHARYVRAGGFWRYVGKTVFERMTAVAGEVDLASGERWEKKRAREGRRFLLGEGEEEE